MPADKRPGNRKGRDAFETAVPPRRAAAIARSARERVAEGSIADKVIAAGELPAAIEKGVAGGLETGSAPGADAPSKRAAAQSPAAVILDASIYTDSMPKPAVVALLDHNLERGNRATAVIVYGFAYHAPDRRTIKVPIGYITDFASIPWLLRWLIAPFGRHARAAILHDWLYAVGEKKRRGYADWIILWALKDLGVGWLLRWTIFLSVRIGGWMGYGNRKEWRSSWADWKTGEPVKPPYDPDRFFGDNWPDDPNLGHS